MSAIALCMVLWPAGDAPTFAAAIEYAPPARSVRRSPPSLRMPSVSMGLHHVAAALSNALEELAGGGNSAAAAKHHQEPA
jgi:hypothetical protein